MSIANWKLKEVTGGEDKDGPNYEAKYLVTATDRHDYVKTILDGMPWNIGDEFSIGNDYDPDAIVLSATADPVPKNNFDWEYSVSFGVPAEDEIENPFAEPPSIELVFAQAERLLEKDIHGKRVQNTVGDRFDDVLTKEDSQPILRLSRNEPTSQALFGVDLRDTTNRTAWQGAARRTVKFQPPTLRSRYHKIIGTYYEKSYEFKFSDETWRFILLNQGYSELGEPDSDGKPVKIPLRVDKNGKLSRKETDDKVTVPYSLTEAGKVLKDSEEPHWIEFDGYRESQFPDFGTFF